ncbi:MAG: phage Gp37/Gp68 family protein [Acidobacteria bacterium]|nr:phage Gp37/Gp68 family protein [Acidobacteriota bacterium]
MTAHVMSQTAIEWTDETWNPVTGCTKVSAACAHCWAERQALRRMAPEWRGERPWTEVRCHPERLEQPLHWRRPRKIAVCLMGDLFHGTVPDAFIDQVFAVMALCPQHVFQVLTKRPERMRKHVTARRLEVMDAARSIRAWREDEGPAWPVPNVWLGTSAEDQKTLDERWFHLRLTPAAVRFLSLEPLLEWVDFQGMYEYVDSETLILPDWVIVGGESGPGARPCDVAWIRSIVRQCQAADVPCFVKQVGANVQDRNDRLSTEGPGCDPWDSRDWPEPEGGWDDGFRGNVERDLGGYRDDYQGAPVRLRLKSRKGGDRAEWPADLRVRQFPEVSRGRV